MINQISELYGRQISRSLVAPEILRSPRIKERAAMRISGRWVICQRCGSRLERQAVQMPGRQYYCPVCIKLGRISTLESLCTVKEPNRFPLTPHPLSWRGQLTTEQRRCSKEVIEGFRRYQARLLWAVTGAGKTEMTFPGLEWGLKRGLRIGVASPRVDVCMEIFPRLQAAFAHVPMVLLHGRSRQKYRYVQLTVCTTHQLLRFYHAFDLLIIDEVDAFPFVNNRPLHFAARQAVKPVCGRLFLTATLNPPLLKMVRQHRIQVSYLPLRFHRHLLPVIKCHLVPRWRRHLRKRRLPTRLVDTVRRDLKRGVRFLLFVPKIRDLKPVSRILRGHFHQRNWRTVYSQDPQRLAKVKLMRENRIKFLITTTILERGVTFPGIDVIVLGADEVVFTASSLVQIAGRVGRKRDRPFGNVEFFIRSYTRSILSAQQQIRHMNRLGAELL